MKHTLIELPENSFRRADVCWYESMIPTSYPDRLLSAELTAKHVRPLSLCSDDVYLLLAFAAAAVLMLLMSPNSPIVACVPNVPLRSVNVQVCAAYVSIVCVTIASQCPLGCNRMLHLSRCFMSRRPCATAAAAEIVIAA